MTFDLDRFKDAQGTEFATALSELRAGRKRTHWIWFVFPQLHGLGSSPPAVRYGLDGLAEAKAYLRDDVLRDRLCQATDAVHQAVCGRGARVDLVMGSGIDALKLVSSLTLFERAARAEEGATAPELADFVEKATGILDAAQAQGYPRCAFTLQRIGTGSAG